MDNPVRGRFLGIDTSCYTTSVACVAEEGIVYDKRTVLSVALGERGLRQSDGVFQHVRNLDALLPEMLHAVGKVDGVCVSVRPRPEQDSYMPVFLAGRTAAGIAAAALNVPLYFTSHQQGHIRAALEGNEELLGAPFLAVHLSGGTTEVCAVSSDLSLRLLGGSEDLHAGQFVDRVGVALGMKFPCGKALEALALQAQAREIRLPASVKGISCSFSGVETRAQQLLNAGAPQAEVAYAVYDCLARTLAKLLRNAREQTGLSRVLLAGGVASSALLRELLEERMNADEALLRFGARALCPDNAVGVALLARDGMAAAQRQD